MPASRPSIVITIDGPAASGKSSTAAMVAEALGYRHLDSGALYRMETARRLGVSDPRSAQVTAAVSAVAKIPEVRAQVNRELREAAREENVVVDGRDIGGVVFPDAQLKIFLVADPRERALRRLRQRLDHEPSESEVAEEAERLLARDARDAINTIQAATAVVIDTTHLSQREQVRQIVELARGVG